MFHYRITFLNSRPELEDGAGVTCCVFGLIAYRNCHLTVSKDTLNSPLPLVVPRDPLHHLTTKEISIFRHGNQDPYGVYFLAVQS